MRNNNNVKIDVFFLGARDNYQVPKALDDAGLLGSFLTDYAFPAWGGAVVARLAGGFRRSVPFAFSKTRCNWRMLGRDMAGRIRRSSSRSDLKCKDCEFVEWVSQYIESGSSHLFSYEPYAGLLFPRIKSDRKKFVFYYHPSRKLEHEILSEDADRWGWGRGMLRRSVDSDRFLSDSSWQHSDFCFFASSFSRSTIIKQGCDQNKTFIVPYGVDIRLKETDIVGDRDRVVLFVGSGIERKGLHHLLHVWRRVESRNPQYRLRIICRYVTERIRSMIGSCENVEVAFGLSDDSVRKEMAAAALMVVPSLYEGFGHVYLEALASGCPVIGTERTCLPDLVSVVPGVSIVRAGYLEELEAELERKICQFEAGVRFSVEIQRAVAEKFNWEGFRRGLCQAIIENT